MSKPRVVAFIQARQTSTRLPNKVLAKIGRWTALELMLERLKPAKSLDQVVILLPDNKENDPLADYIRRQIAISYFRGQEHDVLDRFHQASKSYPAEYYVRLTADCPLICPAIVDEVVNLVIAEKAAYGSNINPPTYPHGFDAECFSAESLNWSHENIQDLLLREHVTLGIRQSRSVPKNWKYVNLEKKSPSMDWIRLTVDCPEDLEVIQRIANICGEEILKMGDDSLAKMYIENNLVDINGKLTTKFWNDSEITRNV